MKRSAWGGGKDSTSTAVGSVDAALSRQKEPRGGWPELLSPWCPVPGRSMAAGTGGADL